MNIRLWAILVAVLIALGGFSWWLSNQQSGPQREEVKLPSDEKLKEITRPRAATKPKTATMQPGRVVVLNTNRGKIEFVLYEKDCPKTTARIAELVQTGAYNGVGFPRAENWVIQTDLATTEVPPMGIEVAKGLLFEKGSVGMARASEIDSNLSVFYITLEPAHHLDLHYTNFGRVIDGMDVARKITLGDRIETATLRPLTDTDRKILRKS